MKDSLNICASFEFVFLKYIYLLLLYLHFPELQDYKGATVPSLQIQKNYFLFTTEKCHQQHILRGFSHLVGISSHQSLIRKVLKLNGGLNRSDPRWSESERHEKQRIFEKMIAAQSVRETGRWQCVPSINIHESQRQLHLVLTGSLRKLSQSWIDGWGVTGQSQRYQDWFCVELQTDLRDWGSKWKWV